MKYVNFIREKKKNNLGGTSLLSDCLRCELTQKEKNLLPDEYFTSISLWFLFFNVYLCVLWGARIGVNINDLQLLGCRNLSPSLLREIDNGVTPFMAGQ